MYRWRTVHGEHPRSSATWRMLNGSPSSDDEFGFEEFGFGLALWLAPRCARSVGDKGNVSALFASSAKSDSYRIRLDSREPGISFLMVALLSAEHSANGLLQPVGDKAPQKPEGDEQQRKGNHANLHYRLLQKFPDKIDPDNE
jgi:hypothetical protein